MEACGQEEPTTADPVLHVSAGLSTGGVSAHQPGPRVLGMEIESAYTPLAPGAPAVLIAGNPLVLVPTAALLFRREDLDD